jgi:hypothetical protein
MLELCWTTLPVLPEAALNPPVSTPGLQQDPPNNKVWRAWRTGEDEAGAEHVGRRTLVRYAPYALFTGSSENGMGTGSSVVSDGEGN